MLNIPLTSIRRINTEKKTIMPHIESSDVAASATLDAKTAPMAGFASFFCLSLALYGGCLEKANTKNTSIAKSCAATIGIAAGG